MAQNMPELMMAFTNLDDNSVTHIREINGPPPMVSVIDVIRLITGSNSNDSAKTLGRLSSQFPEVTHVLRYLKFAGRGQRDTVTHQWLTPRVSRPL